MTRSHSISISAVSILLRGNNNNNKNVPVDGCGADTTLTYYQTMFLLLLAPAAVDDGLTGETTTKWSLQSMRFLGGIFRTLYDQSVDHS